MTVDRTGGGALSSLFPAWSLAIRAAPVCIAVQPVATVLAAVLPITAAWLTKLVVDQIVGPAPSTPHLGRLAIGLALVGVVAAVLPQGVQYLRAAQRRRVAERAKDQLYVAVNRMPGLGRFEDPRYLDRLRLADHAGESAPGAAVDGTLGVGQAVVTGLGFLGSLYLLSPAMAIVVLAVAVPTLAAEILLSRRRASMMWDVGPTERRKAFYASLLSDPRAVKETRLFGIGDFLRGRMLGELRTANAAYRRTDRRELAVQGGLAILSAGGAGAGLVWAVFAAGKGTLTAGDITIFIASVAGVQGALAAVVNHIAATHQQLTLFGHYLTVVRAAPELPLAAKPVSLPPLAKGIEFRDVWFRYSEEHDWVLRGVNLIIPHGDTVGLVGRNGAGKTTLVKLLCRFYDPTKGGIFWDGVDLRDVDPAALRDRIGAVFQDYMSYDLSAAENVGLGDLAALGDRKRIQAAARRADADRIVVGLPRGYDTLLSRMFLVDPNGEQPETGVVLSGGQWQRLALARAFLRDRRDLLILDEPSSGLDAEAEAEIHGRIREHRAGSTSLLVSHRLGTLRDADRIVVLEDGAVTETGSHAELVARNGTYAHLFDLQARGYAGRPGTRLRSR